MDANKLYLVQADTTVGFSCASSERLSDVKQRPRSQKILQTVESFKTLTTHTRVPKKHRRRVRYAQRTTFIYPNGEAFRKVSQKSEYYNTLKKFKKIYSTSANLTGQRYDEAFALQHAEVIVYTKEGFSDTASSKMYKLTREKFKKIR